MIGLSRDTFYRYKAAAEEGGVEAGDNIDLHKPLPSSKPQFRIEIGKN